MAEPHRILLFGIKDIPQVEEDYKLFSVAGHCDGFPKRKSEFPCAAAKKGLFCCD